MTYSEEFQTDLADDSPDQEGYFEAFGVEFTSTIVGTLLAIVGVVGAGAFWWFLIRPIVVETEGLKLELQTRQGELQTKQAAGKGDQITALEAQLVEEERITEEVINAYGKDKQIQTLLIDLNRIFTASDIQLASYETESLQPEFIIEEENEYGPAAKDQLKLQTFEVSFENMTYAQVSSMLENIDLLQPLIVLREFSTAVSTEAKYSYSEAGLITQEPSSLEVSFIIDALVAPTPEEVEAHKQALAAGGGQAPPADPPQ